jgi:hypothetical protein
MDNQVDVQKTTLVGGPCCGCEVPARFRRAWIYTLPDDKRKMLHTYTRKSPNEPYFYYQASQEDV